MTFNGLVSRYDRSAVSTELERLTQAKRVTAVYGLVHLVLRAYFPFRILRSQESPVEAACRLRKRIRAAELPPQLGSSNDRRRERACDNDRPVRFRPAGSPGTDQGSFERALARTARHSARSPRHRIDRASEIAAERARDARGAFPCSRSAVDRAKMARAR